MKIITLTSLQGVDGQSNSGRAEAKGNMGGRNVSTLNLDNNSSSGVAYQNGNNTCFVSKDNDVDALISDLLSKCTIVDGRNVLTLRDKSHEADSEK